MPREALIREAIMKRQALLLLAGLTCLTACGGGGGGPSVNGGSTGGAVVSTPTMLNSLTGGAEKDAAVSDDLSNLGQGAQAALSAAIDLGGGYTLEKGSLVIKDGTGAAIGRFKTGLGGDVDLYKDGYIVGMKDASKEATMPGFTEGFFEDQPGSMRGEKDGIRYNLEVSYPHEAIVMNSEAVDLDYSSFGLWAVNYKNQGSMTNISTGESLNVDVEGVWIQPFFGSKDKSKEVMPASGASFSGKAVALAHSPGNEIWGERIAPVNEFIRGDAELSVATDASTVSLDLTFPGYYDIAYKDTALQGSGAFASGSVGGTVSVRKNATYDPGKTEFVFDTNNIQSLTGATGYSNSTYLYGQFFGTGGQASEATGKFQVTDGSNGNITGAFGVK